MKILVLCTGNSCRSQMAEGLLNHHGSPFLEASSAGIEAHGVNPLAVEVLKEKGVDISHHQSNKIGDVENEVFDVVLTVCDNAREHCPFLPGVHLSLHKDFHDPSKNEGDESQKLKAFREVRDEIEEYCLALIEQLKRYKK